LEKQDDLYTSIEIPHHHSDQNIQYNSEACQQIHSEHNSICSMTVSRNCYQKILCHLIQKNCVQLLEHSAVKLSIVDNVVSLLTNLELSNYIL